MLPFSGRLGTWSHSHNTRPNATLSMVRQTRKLRILCLLFFESISLLSLTQRPHKGGVLDRYAALRPLQPAASQRTHHGPVPRNQSATNRDKMPCIRHSESFKHVSFDGCSPVFVSALASCSYCALCFPPRAVAAAVSRTPPCTTHHSAALHSFLYSCNPMDA